MKLLLICLFMIGCSAIMGQSNDTLFVSRLADISWTKNYTNSSRFGFIEFEDGSVLAVGDMMRIGVPSGTNESSAQQPGLFSSNRTRTNNFSYIMLGRMGAAIMGGITYLPETFKGKDAQIQDIKIFRSRKENVPSTASVIFQNPGMDITVLDLKSALQFGELINPKAAMTSDEALEELKKDKDKLDLGLISQETFDSLRTTLAKYIK